MGREVARQRRKATDPQERAKEERKQRQLRAMMKEKERRKIAEEVRRICNVSPLSVLLFLCGDF